ncbi:hypothetical protein AB0395_08675 [Streptosporangium sp. NPDC051023]|uniref:hypothetical protein n=1 Tax=Streptosporangium sp. NPDC051023 TaxID=3155410 RepID=UPI00344EBA41
MESTQIAIATVAIVVFVVYRQMVTRPTAKRGILIFALVLVAAGLGSGGVLDFHPSVLSVVVVAAEVVTAIAFGALRASTVRVWRDEAGVTWSKGTGWTMLAWLFSFTARLVLFAVGNALGLAFRPTAALIFAGLTVATQALLVAYRGRLLSATVGQVGQKEYSWPLT